MQRCIELRFALYKQLFVSMCSDLISKTMNRKHLDSSKVRTTGVKSGAAQTLFPNIASVHAISTEQLLLEHVSRKTMEHSHI